MILLLMDQLKLAFHFNCKEYLLVWNYLKNHLLKYEKKKMRKRKLFILFLYFI